MFLHLFWFRSWNTDFYEIIEYSNSFIEKTERSSTDLFGRNYNNAENFGETSDETIFFQQVGFIINTKKLGLKQAHKIGFLGLIIDAVKMTLNHTEKKFINIAGKCQDLLSNVDVRIEKKWFYFFYHFSEILSFQYKFNMNIVY